MDFVLSLSGVPTSLGLLEPACCGLMFKGAGLCLALANFSGASCVSVEGEGGFISVGFTGVGLIL